MNRLKNIRTGDIEARISGTDKYAYEIVKWFKNDLYGHKDEYEKDSFGMYVKKDGSSMAYFSESCFVNPESCYVLCWVTDSDEPDINTVGMRPFDLQEDDYENFMKVLRMAVRNVAESYRD